jgi:hypothetical protein
MPKTPQQITMWLNRIERCEALQAERKQERLQAIKLYTSSFLSNPTNNNTELSDVNFVYEYVKIMVGGTYAKDPYIFVRTKVSSRQAFSETMERALNVYWRKLGMKAKIKKALLDGILQPPGFIHLGYLLLTEKNELKKTLEEEFPELKSTKPDKVESQQGILDETVKEDDIFSNFLSTWNVLWPDGYHDIRECPYLIIKQKMSLEDLYNNPMYGKIKYDINPSFGMNKNSQRPADYRMNKSHPPGQMMASEMDKELIDVTLCHVFDRRGQEVFTVVKNFVSGVLMEKSWPFLSDGFPTFPLIFNEIPATDEKANSYPLSDIVPMLPQLKELSYISSAMNRHRKRAGTFIGVKKGSLSPAEITNMQNSHDLDVVELSSLSEDSLKMVVPPGLPNDFYQIRGNLIEDLMRVSGYNQLLGSVRGVTTATESENVRAGALIRQNERIDIIEDFVTSIAKFMAGMLWQFKTRQQISEILGEEVSPEMWPEFPEDKLIARKIVENDLYFEIDAGSTQPPKDVAVERKQWSDLVAQIKAAFPNRLKDDVILAQLLKKYDFKDIDNALIKFDDEEIATAQKENEYLLQGIPQVVGPNENDMLHLQVHSQAYQVPGMQLTPQMDEHINAHMESMQRKNPSQFPQKGDSKIPTKTAGNPEISRGGVPDMSDFLGSVTSQQGTGQNIGGRRGA